jgi:hypothetical protein
MARQTVLLDSYDLPRYELHGTNYESLIINGCHLLRLVWMKQD